MVNTIGFRTEEKKIFPGTFSLLKIWEKFVAPRRNNKNS